MALLGTAYPPTKLPKWKGYTAAKVTHLHLYALMRFGPYKGGGLITVLMMTEVYISGVMMTMLLIMIWDKQLGLFRSLRAYTRLPLG